MQQSGFREIIPLIYTIDIWFQCCGAFDSSFELWCWRRLLRVPSTVRRSNQPILKEVNPEYSLEGPDAEAEAPILWPPDVKKRPRCWERQEKGTTEDAMLRWYYWLDRHEFEQTLGDGEGQGSLACCSPWGHIELEMT